MEASDKGKKKKYICHRCFKQPVIGEDEKYCPFCGTYLSEEYSKRYFYLENELKKRTEAAVKAEVENFETKNKYSNNAKKIKELKISIDKYSTKCYKYYTENNISEEEAFTLNLLNKISIQKLKKYEEVLGKEYIRERVYFEPKSQASKYQYIEYISLSKQEKEQYDGLKNFRSVTMDKVDQWGNYWEIRNESSAQNIFIYQNSNETEVYPGELIAEENFSETNGQIYSDMFETKIKYSEAETELKCKIEVEPAVLSIDNFLYKLEKKGTITYLRRPIEAVEEDL
ncbi:MAG: hypothetical protein LUC97_09775 [Clostridiales bacterium]|nr:hypothetical protein [Clostridiales bacterium]